MLTTQKMESRTYAGCGAVLFVAIFSLVAILPWDARAASSWSVTKVTDGASGPYCAVSRKIDQTAVTVGRTLQGASSLALEMSGAKLDPKKVYTVTLKPGANNPVDIETKPVNDKTFVLNVDKVIDLSAVFKDSPTVQIRYDDKTLALVLNDWDSAGDELGLCLSSLKPPARPQPIVEARPATPLKPLPAATDVAKRILESPATSEPVPIVRLSDENKKLREENMVLRGAQASADVTDLQRKLKDAQDQLQAMKDARAADLNSASATVQKGRDQAMRLATFESENASLREQLAGAQARLAASKATPAPVPVAAPSTELVALQNERDRLARENTELQQKLTENAASITSAKAFGEEIARLKVERDTAQTKLAAALKGPVKKGDVGVLQERIDLLTGERDELKRQIEMRTTEQADPAVADLQERLDMLAAENLRLRANLTNAQKNPADTRVAVAAEAPLRQQLRDRQAENDSLRSRVDELQKQLDRVLGAGEKKLIQSAGGNWDLEQATRRLQESERDVQRLSMLVRDQKAQCETEKKQIEYMLFDPKLAKDGQIALLNSLEDEVARLKSEKGVPVPAQMTGAVATGTPLIPPSLLSPSASRPEVFDTQVSGEDSAEEVNASTMTALIRRAGIALSGTLSPVAKNPFGPGKAWRYESGELMGLVVTQAAVKADSFDRTVERQVQNLKAACKGTFAAQPATEDRVKNLTYAAYDAACIAGDRSTSAAIVFFQRNGTLNIMSHESGPDTFDKAMGARDKIISALIQKAR